MPAPCVVLATSAYARPIDKKELKDYEARLKILLDAFDCFNPGTKESRVLLKWNVQYHAADDVEGGNGGGGEPGGSPMKPCVGELGAAAWDFQGYVYDPHFTRDEMFPPILHFGFCRQFGDISEASTFLHQTDVGLVLPYLFRYVQIIIESKPKRAIKPAKWVTSLVTTRR